MVSKKKSVVKTWVHGDVFPAGRTVYKAVQDARRVWYILECITTGDGVTIAHTTGLFAYKFKVPSVLVQKAWKVNGGECGKCFRNTAKTVVYTSKVNFCSNFRKSFRYEVGKLIIAEDYSPSPSCGKGIHTWLTKRAALAYAG